MKIFLRTFIISYLVGIFPIIFLYNQNSAIINPTSLLLPLVVLLVTTICLSLLFSIIYQSNPASSWISSFISLLLFNFYGILYDYLIKADIFQIDHATLIPIMIFVIILFVRIAKDIIKIKSQKPYFALIFIFSGLIIFNIASIIPVELNKNNNFSIASNTSNPEIQNTKIDIAKPDVYYIILDESVGFEAIREYWKYNDIQEFEKFLVNTGFYIAKNSKSKTTDTLIEIASRLNYADQSKNTKDYPQALFHNISENRTMQLFKEYGYKTIVIDQVRAANGFITKTPIKADFNLESPKVSSHNWAFDDFFLMVFDRTILRPFCETLRIYDPAIIQHRNDVNYFFDKLSNLEKIESPKFVYAHVLLTHVPLVFNENGGSIDVKNYYNWDYYLDSYKFEVKKVEQLVTSLLLKSNPDNPPIIIIQSDHGFRNINSGHVGSTILKNYPEEYKYSIINVLYLPGYDYSKLPESIDPINTFPLIFNYYLKENIPLIK